MKKEYYESNEQCWVILGRLFGAFWLGRISYLSQGSPSEVEFNASLILEREDDKHDVIGFVHTHPNTDASPSFTDHATMQAWVTALGKPLVCGIDGTDGLKSFVYTDDESKGYEGRIIKFGKFVCGVNTIG